MSFEVESNIPFPARVNQQGGRPNIYPFETMKIGDSFFAAPDVSAKAVMAVKAWKRNHGGWNYTTLKVDGGVRIWRTA